MKEGEIINKRQKELAQAQLDSEKAVLKQLEKNYKDALDEINSKIELLLARQDADMQHVIYQVEYQKALKTQVQAILETLQANEFETVSEYLAQSYEDGFIGTMYDLQGQGIPLVFPIDQEQVVAALQHETKLSAGLYVVLGKDIKDLSKKISGEISRGISGGQMYSEIARNIAGYAGIPKNNAMRIVRTEAHRIQCKATSDAQWKAKSKGADVVKQWDSTMDGKTRDTHRELDGQIRELDEEFEVAGHKAMYPGGFGRPEEDINCRCALLQRARWALGNDYTKWSKDAPVEISDDGTTQFVNIEAKNYKEFQEKYKQATERVRESAPKINQKEKVPKSTEEISEEGTNALRQAYEEHRIANNLTSAPLGELGDDTGFLGADYGNLSLESAKRFNETLGRLIEEYDTPLSKVRPMTKNEFMMLRDSFALVTHDYSADTATMILNVSKLKDFEKHISRIETLSEEIGHITQIIPGLEGEYVITHEFAHSLLGMTDKLSKNKNWVNADYAKLKNARKEVEEVYSDYTKNIAKLQEKYDALETRSMELLMNHAPLEEIEAADKAFDEAYEALNRAKISEYSLENSDEFMAEAFTDARIGSNPSDYSIKVKAILDKYFKKS